MHDWLEKILLYSPKILGVVAFVLIFVSLARENHFKNSPQMPDKITGRTAPLGIKGIGTVYVTEAEARSTEWPIETGLFLILAAGGLEAFLASRNRRKEK